MTLTLSSLIQLPIGWMIREASTMFFLTNQGMLIFWVFAFASFIPSTRA